MIDYYDVFTLFSNRKNCLIGKITTSGGKMAPCCLYCPLFHIIINCKLLRFTPLNMIFKKVILKSISKEKKMNVNN